MKNVLFALAVALAPAVAALEQQLTLQMLGTRLTSWAANGEQHYDEDTGWTITQMPDYYAGNCPGRMTYSQDEIMLVHPRYRETKTARFMRLHIVIGVSCGGSEYDDALSWLSFLNRQYGDPASEPSASARYVRPINILDRRIKRIGTYTWKNPISKRWLDRKNLRFNFDRPVRSEIRLHLRSDRSWRVNLGIMPFDEHPQPVGEQAKRRSIEH